MCVCVYVWESFWMPPTNCLRVYHSLNQTSYCQSLFVVLCLSATWYLGFYCLEQSTQRNNGAVCSLLWCLPFSSGQLTDILNGRLIDCPKLLIYKWGKCCQIWKSTHDLPAGNWTTDSQSLSDWKTRRSTDCQDGRLNDKGADGITN